MAVYLKYEGIDGEATHEKHTKWIEVHSLQFGVGRGISTPTGATTNRESSQPSVSEVVITKMLDSSSTALFAESVTGTAGKKVEIHLVNTGDPGDTYVEYTLTDSLISGYSVSSGGDRPSESISINFTKIEFKFTSFDAKNKTASPTVVGYNMATGKKI
ncbi:type VI secretion system tube protein Hcp [Shinella sp. S4-D37]|uniref:Hcp family type VI secretion system effector n=1 Tax=Shinella sp. S4-D37 TaxID=3161999 RepID=UPI003467DDEB